MYGFSIVAARMPIFFVGGIAEDFRSTGDTLICCTAIRLQLLDFLAIDPYWTIIRTLKAISGMWAQVRNPVSKFIVIRCRKFRLVTP
jgi:hypothetical protein